MYGDMTHGHLMSPWRQSGMLNGSMNSEPVRTTIADNGGDLFSQRFAQAMRGLPQFNGQPPMMERPPETQGGWKDMFGVIGGGRPQGGSMPVRPKMPTPTQPGGPPPVSDWAWNGFGWSDPTPNMIPGRSLGGGRYAI